MIKFCAIAFVAIQSLMTISVFCAPNFGFEAANPIVGDGKIIDINNPNQDDMREIEDLKVNLTALREQQAKLKRRFGIQNRQIPPAEADSNNTVEQLDSMRINDPHLWARKL